MLRRDMEPAGPSLARCGGLSLVARNRRVLAAAHLNFGNPEPSQLAELLRFTKLLSQTLLAHSPSKEVHKVIDPLGLIDPVPPILIFMPLNMLKAKFPQHTPHACAILNGYDGIVLVVLEKNRCRLELLYQH
jgi:hypothetical protein